MTADRERELERISFPLRYVEDDDGGLWISSQSLIDYCREIAAELDSQADALVDVDEPDDLSIAGLCGATRALSDLADAFVLFELDPSRAGE